MLQRHAPRWVYAGALLLTAVAGCINAVAFHNAFHAVTHMTGSIFSVSVELGRGKSEVALRAIAVVFVFFVGAAISGFIVRQSSLHAGRRYGVALLVESALLFAAWVGLLTRSAFGEMLAAMACGLQNALATSYSGAVIRTTHMTGVVTDLGIAVGHFVAGEHVEWFRTRLHLVLLLGFVFGGATGAWAVTVFGNATLLGPAVVTGAAGLIYIIQRYRRRHPSTSSG